MMKYVQEGSDPSRYRYHSALNLVVEFRLLESFAKQFN